MYFVTEENGYIISVQMGGDGTPITEEEYRDIINVMRSKPKAPEGYGYHLKTDLTWELYELPAPDPDPEITDSEALAIIAGGDSA